MTDRVVDVVAKAIWEVDAPRVANEPMRYDEVAGWQKSLFRDRARAAIAAFEAFNGDVTPVPGG